MLTRRNLLLGMAGAAGAIAASAAEHVDSEALRATYRSWLATLPEAPSPALNMHGVAATELGRWRVMEANQG
ncbi:MAG: hypothetical protein SV422_15495, partial [Pseudomonadota bacterium]|nr:hypothetical protein [Pseudomonadota bacterium]